MAARSEQEQRNRGWRCLDDVLVVRGWWSALLLEHLGELARGRAGGAGIPRCDGRAGRRAVDLPSSVLPRLRLDGSHFQSVAWTRSSSQARGRRSEGYRPWNVVSRTWTM